MSAADRAKEIASGIEWFGDDGNPDPACSRCGSSAEWVRCQNCVDGYSHHDCGEDTCCCLYPDDNVRCNWCEGRGGSLHCVSSPEWCQANPMPGREAVESTAMSPEAWRDAD